MKQTCFPLSQNHAPECSPNGQCEADVEIRQLKKKIVTGERTNQLQAKPNENTKLKAELKKLRGIRAQSSKLIRAKNTSLKKK